MPRYPEKWLPVVGYEEFYSVSNHGNVFSERKARLLRPAGPCPSYPYRTVVLFKDEVGKTQLVHRLVYKAFMGDIPAGLVINHKDNKPWNNRLPNLEAVSQQDNIRHSWKCGRNKIPLTEKDIRKIRRLYVEGSKPLVIGRKFGVPTRSIESIISGEAWDWVKDTASPARMLIYPQA